MNTKLFSELGLSPELLKAVDNLGFEQAAPIQAEAIPVLMQGRDVVGQSQTGSGKTAAFAIPAIEKTNPQERAVQVLILCPTRELAVQVAEDVHKLALFKRGIHVLPVYGGQSYERQYQGLKQGAQIVIGTPGRVMDHMRRGTLRLGSTRMVVLDEADVMLDMGFREDIEFILQGVAKEHQTVFFSATMPRAIQELIQKYARDPVNVRIEQKTVTVPTVEQLYYEVDRRFKVELLTRLVDIHDYKLGIIFCNTKRMVDELVDHLEAQGYSADRLHGDMTQAMRDRVMNKFRKSGLEFLVATDVAARGIDVHDVQVVFNYDLPYDVEDYVHRIGRTGRAGRSGQAISFVAGRELFQIQHIERYTKTRIQRSKIPTQNEVEEARASVFLDNLRATLQGGQFPKQDHIVGRLLEEGFSSTDIASALIYQLQAVATPVDEPATRPDAFGGRDERTRERPSRSTESVRGSDRGPSRERPSRSTPVGTSAPARKSVQATPATPRGPVAASLAAAPQVTVAASSPVSKPAVASPVAAPKPVATIKAASKPVIAGPEPARKPAVAAPGAAASLVPKGLSTPPTRPAPAPVRPGKPSHPLGTGRTRLHLNVGVEMGVEPNDITQAIAGHTGLPAAVVGALDLRERHAFVDVASEHANAIIAKLTRTQIRGRKLKVKVA